MVRIVIVEDHESIRGLLCKLLQEEPDIQVVGAAGDGREGLQIVAEQHPDVVISDLVMPEMNGLELTRELRRQFQAIGIIILRMYGESIFVEQAIKAGALGYILKGDDFKQIVRAIHDVSSGRRYLSPSLRALSPRPVGPPPDKVW
jgi:DNA-binding NarL/FixJ family response regulator